MESSNQKNQTKSKLDELKQQLNIESTLPTTQVSDKESFIIEPKQMNFIVEYMKDYNATQAAIRAGYSEKTAQEQSSRMLSKVIIKEEIKRRQDLIDKSNNITKQYIQEEILSLIQDCYTDEKTDRTTIVKCIDMLNKMNGHYMPDTQVNIQNNFDGEIRINIIKPDNNIYE